MMSDSAVRVAVVAAVSPRPSPPTAFMLYSTSGGTAGHF